MEFTLRGRPLSVLRLGDPALRRFLGRGGPRRSQNAYKERDYATALREGIKAGVMGTPAYLIHGVFLSGAQPQAEFEKIIDAQLAALGNSPRLAANQ